MDTLALIKQAHEGDKEARELLVMENVGLIWSIIKRFSGRGYDMEDLYQIGCIGLIKAIDKFDESFDVKLSTYAVPMITGEIRRFMRDDGMIKVSRKIKENQYRVLSCIEKLTQQYGREATINEIANECGLKEEEVIGAIEASNEIESLQKTVSSKDGNDFCLMEKISDRFDDDEVVDKIFIKQLLDSITKEERKLIELRYFEDMTQTEIAKKLGMSQVQVSRMEKRILTQLRKNA